MDDAQRFRPIACFDDPKAALDKELPFGGQGLGIVVDDEHRPRAVIDPHADRPCKRRSVVFNVMKTPRAMRPASEVVPKLGAKPGVPALRVGGVATYDRPLEHLAGQLDVIEPRLPLRARDGRYGLVLCFALGESDLARLGQELIRVAHPDGAVWVVVWKKDHLPLGAPSWDESQEAILETGWVDNKILSLGGEVYATRYVRRRRPGKGEPPTRVGRY